MSAAEAPPRGRGAESEPRRSGAGSGGREGDGEGEGKGEKNGWAGRLSRTYASSARSLTQPFYLHGADLVRELSGWSGTLLH